MPGIDGTAADDGTRAVRIDLVEDEALLPGAASEERLAQAADADGRVAATIDAADGGGFSLWADGFGTAWIRSDGGEVLCAPATGPAWRWQRFLTGQVLPFVAVLHGLEVFHASAVVLDGRALAIVAGSGSGKSTIALNLALRGLPFLNDDVLVLALDVPGGLEAQPGAPLANVDRAELELSRRVEEAGLGRTLGVTDGEIRMAVRRHEVAVPLGAVFYLERPRSGDRAYVERLDPVDPRLLLAATFNLSLRGPDRLARQLEACGRMAESSAIFRVSSPAGIDPRAVAEEIHQAADSL